MMVIGRLISGVLTACALLMAASADAAEQGPLRVAVFSVDVTPPIGSPVAYAPVRKVEDPLLARGIVILGVGDPIVLCAVDWLGISNDGNQLWREKLAQGAGTMPDRVSVHVLHQHDGPRCDFRAEELLASIGKERTRFDSPWCREAIERAAETVHAALRNAQPVTHLGTGSAIVEKVASNRRVLGPDGKVQFVRMSKCTNPKAIAAPEGTIDPELKLISFWNGEIPVASITYYATHPQSYYGQGDVSPDFVGLARMKRQSEVPEAMHIHFNGASGNVAAGKYNDGSVPMRAVLTDRLADGMRRAWESTRKVPLGAADVEWRTTTVQIPVATHLELEKLQAAVQNEKKSDLRTYAPKLSWIERAVDRAVPIELGLLKLKDVLIFHLPGEPFVEYQLAAQQMCPENFVCMAAYGDTGTGYIGTEIAYSQGGYETEPDSSNVSPAVEKVLMDGMRKLVGK